MWKNPFLSKNSEQQLSAGEFLSLFDAKVLRMINENNLLNVTQIIGAPGSGKTSLFRAFSTRVLKMALQKPDEYTEYCDEMKRLGVIKNGRSVLISANLSCARNYNLIDEMFQNGARKRVLLALLNYRFVISLIRNIAESKEIEDSEYNRITFTTIPIELMSERADFLNGETVFEWACAGERELCKYLDSEREDELVLPYSLLSFSTLELFQAENILVDGRNHFERILVILDDFHKLTLNQQKSIIEALYTLKASISVWIGLRPVNYLSNIATPFITSDGSFDRNYNEVINIDVYWPNYQTRYQEMLEGIADKRVKEASIAPFSVFADCVSEKPDYTRYMKCLQSFIDKKIKHFEEDAQLSMRFKKVIQYVRNDCIGILEQAIICECIFIYENRKNEGQQELYFGEVEEVNQFINKFVEDNRKAAYYYICINNEIPYYCGLANLKIISTYNVEQFLLCAGNYYEAARLKLLEGKKRNRNVSLKPEEQEKVLSHIVNKMWEDIDSRFYNAADIKHFLECIAEICTDSRKQERNSYTGGAYTAIAITLDNMKEISSKEKYRELYELINSCLASKCLEYRAVRHGQKIALYLNRWLCVKYQLPLAYGNWFTISLAQLKSFIRKKVNE